MMAIVTARKQNETPLHNRIRTHLLAAMKSGQLRPGDRVPSEWQLAEQFAVSRMTARQALSDLTMSGYLQRRRGKGTFVAPEKLEQSLGNLTGFTHDIRRRGLTPHTQVLGAGSIPAGRRMALALDVGPEESLYVLERLRLVDGEPLALETAYIPARLAPALLTCEGLSESLYKVLAEHYGIRLARAAQVVEVVPAGPHESRHLRVGEGTPLLRLERVARDATGRPVELAHSYYRGDRYRFTTDMSRWKEE
ncbi:MAG TPA: GntR family transcriptional regulator [Symbiobacteriaceae bacterium]|jgi:GntR family transcriptional regulator|nr:GntR family transcriptional regulator [Symbiobacteriaceae bacterium]